MSFGSEKRDHLYDKMIRRPKIPRGGQRIFLVSKHAKKPKGFDDLCAASSSAL
jgi:hypothetical protein